MLGSALCFRDAASDGVRGRHVDLPVAVRSRRRMMANVHGHPFPKLRRGRTGGRAGVRDFVKFHGNDQ